MKNFSLKKILPYVASLAVFVVLTLIYLSPMMEGKKLHQGDMTQYIGSSQELRSFYQETGEYSQWTGSQFGGMPSYQIYGGFTGNKVKQYGDYLFGAKLPHPINSVLLYFLGFYVLLLVLRVNPWLSIAGAIAFAFSSYFFIILAAGHVTKSIAIGYMPFVVAGIILIYQRKYLLGTALTALFMALQLGANHVQITYYMGLCLIAFGIAELISVIRTKEWKPFLISTACTVAAVLIGVGANINLLTMTAEYSKDTIRGKSELTSNEEIRTSGLDMDYATQWSYGKVETFTLMIPDFMGGASQRVPGDHSNVYQECIENRIPPQQARQLANGLPMYWGTQPFTSGPVYVGAIVCFLFILGLFIVKGKWKWWLLAATILSIFLSWGKNFMPLTEFFMHYVPGYNKFRTVSMILVIAELTMPLLGFLALKNIWDEKVSKERLLNGIKWSLVITGGLCLFFILLKNVLFDFSTEQDYAYGLPEWLIQALHEDRAAMLTKDAIRSLIFIILAGIILFFYQKHKINKAILVATFALLILVDMWVIDKRYLNNDNFVPKKAYDNQFQMTEADKRILTDKDPHFRVFNQTVSPFNDATTSYYHKSVGGYHGAKLRRYQDIIDQHLTKGNMNVFNMLNTKYFIVPGQNNVPQAQYNPGALGNAWFVEEWVMVQDADQEIEALHEIDPARTAVIDQRFDQQLEGFIVRPDSTAFITFEEYRPNYLKYHSKTTVPNLVVFSEIYYDKGWNAYLDGMLVPYFRTNYILRGMIVPEGEHIIEFKFEPATFYKVEKASLAFSVVVFLLLLGAITNEVYRMVKNRKTVRL